ncbi:hypothetical protein N500_0583, partial [Wolbachia pipientis wUni]
SYDIDKLKFLHLEGGGLYHLTESQKELILQFGPISLQKESGLLRIGSL